jgi:hypothetical protein
MENLNKDIDLKKYNNPTGVSLEEMNFGLWLSENRQRFLKILTVSLIVLTAGLFIYSSYSFIIYFMSSSGQSALTTNTMVTSPRNVASDLVIAPVQTFPGNSNSDLAVEISNPNDKFMASFQYCFQQNGQNLFCGKSYIMPSEQKYILDLGQVITSGQDNPSFIISNIFWQRINAHKIPDWNTYATTHLNFPVNDLSFSPAAASGLSNEEQLNSLSFSINNSTAYSYHEVPLNILFFKGSDLVGVNRYLLENFSSSDSRKIKIVWPGDLSNVSQTQIVPDVNIMDNSVFAPYSGTVTQ